MTEELELLRRGRLEVEGRLVDASNQTFYCGLTLNGVSAAAVYKPMRGERPLWDFPHGSLGGREAATYLVSDAAGWGVVPSTVLRDGPMGPGMCQLWIEVDPEKELIDVVPRGRVPAGWRRVFDAMDGNGREVSLVHADSPSLRRMAILDAICNNADRKGGHVLVDETGAVFGVDHGLCFHVEDKLRTVLWGWSEEPLTPEELADLERLETDLAARSGQLAELDRLLEREEIDALADRIAELRRSAVFPTPGDWSPVIPWPVF